MPLVASPQGRPGAGPGTTTYVGPPPLPDGSIGPSHAVAGFGVRPRMPQFVPGAALTVHACSHGCHTASTGLSPAVSRAPAEAPTATYTCSATPSGTSTCAPSASTTTPPP